MLKSVAPVGTATNNSKVVSDDRCEDLTQFFVLRQQHKEAIDTGDFPARQRALALLISLSATIRNRAVRQAIAEHVNAHEPNLRMIVE